MRGFQVRQVARKVLAGDRYRGQLDGRIDPELVAPRRGREVTEDPERLFVVGGRFRVGVELVRSVAGEQRVLDGPIRLVAPRVVVGQNRRLLVEAVPVQLLDGGADRGMEVLAPLEEQALIGHILDDGVLEDVLHLGKETLLMDQLHVRQCLEATLDFGGDLRDAGEEAEPELSADDGRRLRRPFHSVLEPVQARTDDVLDGGRELDGRAPRPGDAAARRHQHAALLQ